MMGWWADTQAHRIPKRIVLDISKEEVKTVKVVETNT